MYEGMAGFIQWCLYVVMHMLSSVVLVNEAKRNQWYLSCKVTFCGGMKHREINDVCLVKLPYVCEWGIVESMMSVHNKLLANMISFMVTKYNVDFGHYWQVCFITPPFWSVVTWFLSLPIRWFWYISLAKSLPIPEIIMGHLWHPDRSVGRARDW